MNARAFGNAADGASVRASLPVSMREVGQGEHRAVDRPGAMLAATLGSCVALCLHDRRMRLGGMTHIFRCVDPGPMGTAAVVSEIELLVNALVRLGSRRTDLRARVAGGAHVLGRGRDHGGEIADAVLDYIVTERIPLYQKDIGGQRARRILFDPVEGRLRIGFPGHAPKGPAAPHPTTPPSPELF